MTKSKQKIHNPTLWVIESDLILRTYLEMVLIEEWPSIHLFEDDYEARLALKKTMPDLVLMNYILKHGDTLDFCRELRGLSKYLPIIILSGRQLLSDRLACLKAGADLFLSKPFEVEELKAYLSIHLNKSQLFKEHLPYSLKKNHLKAGKLTLKPTTKEAYWNKKAFQLTPLEFQILWLLSSQSGTVTRQQMLRELWPDNRHESSRCVDQAIKRLRQSLKSQAITGLMIQTLHRKGYCLQCT